MIIYFDMDGVLVDFVKQANKYGCFTKKSKVNWKKVIKLGTKFLGNYGMVTRSFSAIFKN